MKVSNLALRVVPISPRGEQLGVDPTASTFSEFPLAIGRHSWEAGAPGDGSGYVVEDQSPYNISRKHCSVELLGDQLEVVEHGSSLGTTVNGIRIGNSSGRMQAPLHMGDNVIVLGGTKHGKHFRFTVFSKTD